MKIQSSDGAEDHHQEVVNSYFEKMASYWIGIYERDGVHEFIHQQRLQIVRELVDRIDLPQHAQVLDIGCGAGHATVALAKRGYAVEAIDPVQAMVESTRNLATKAGLDGRVRSSVGDVHALSFADETFGLVVAMGVLPWLPSMEQPVREMCRVLRQGGHLIVTVDNRWGLRWFLEPLTNPLVSSAKEMVKKVLRRSRQRKRGICSYVSSIRGCDALLDASGLQKLDGITLGFGPFTFLDHHLLPGAVGLRVHRSLQGFAGRRIPVLRSIGSQYIVLARKRRGASARPGLVWNTSRQSAARIPVT